MILLLALVNFLFLLAQGRHGYIPDPNDPICRAPLDLIFIVEEGCSYMDEPKCLRLKQHLVDLAFHFQVGHSNKDTRIGVISYGPTSHLRLPLSSGGNIKSVIHSVENINCNAPSGSANDLVTAINVALREFSRSPRYVLGYRSSQIPQAIIIYPLCDCTMNSTLCKPDNPKTNALVKKLSGKQVSVYVSGHMTSAHDYMCLISNADKDNYLFDNQKCDMLPYIFDAQALARLYCPEATQSDFPFGFNSDSWNAHIHGDSSSSSSSSSSDR